MFPSYIATRPPSSPLESEASEVASCHLHSRSDHRAAVEFSRQHALPGQ